METLLKPHGSRGPKAGVTTRTVSRLFTNFLATLESDPNPIVFLFMDRRRNFALLPILSNLIVGFVCVSSKTVLVVHLAKVVS
jgi:hypothetical protein